MTDNLHHPRPTRLKAVLAAVRRPAGLVGLLMLATACARLPAPLHGDPLTPPKPAPVIDLRDTRGRPFHIGDEHGSILLLYFGYTNCPDECPATLANVDWMLDALGDQADRVRLAFVTVDPARDTPQVLRLFLDRFDPRFVGLTGGDQDLAATRAAYGVVAQAEPGSTELLHSATLFLIDADGQLRSRYDLSVPRGDILADLRVLLGGSA